MPRHRVSRESEGNSVIDARLCLAPEDVCEELKDGQWPDPSDCKSYFLCRGVGSQWGEQKREVCYTGNPQPGGFLL